MGVGEEIEGIQRLFWEEMVFREGDIEKKEKTEMKEAYFVSGEFSLEEEVWSLLALDSHSVLLLRSIFCWFSRL